MQSILSTQYDQMGDPDLQLFSANLGVLRVSAVDDGCFTAEAQRTQR
jgi:hypothetical protein